MEHDSDIVSFIYRDDSHHPDSVGTADVIVAKQPNGPSGKARSDFLERLTGFAVTGSRRLGHPTQPADEEGAASVT